MKVDKDKFLERIYSLDDVPEEELMPAVEYIMECFDLMLSNGEYNLATEVASWLDFNRLSLSTLVSFLTTTYTYHWELPDRPKWYKAIRSIAIKRKNRFYARSLLRGLKECEKDMMKFHEFKELVHSKETV